MNDLASQLLARSADLECLVPTWQTVGDVLRRRLKQATYKPKAPPAVVTQQPGEQDRISQPQTCNESPYLPRNVNEHPYEYEKRLRMTPMLLETPSVAAQRQGALFREQPQLQLSEPLAYLKDRATLAGQSFADLQVVLAMIAQAQGFAGLLLDRPAVAPELAGKDVSVEQARRAGLSQVYFAPFAATQILGWGRDAEGLAWVKVREHFLRQTAWNSVAVQVDAVRVVTRTQITLFEVTTDKEGKQTVADKGTVNHGAKDAAGRAVVPFLFVHPAPDFETGIGESLLAGVAEADIAATQVLSELLWTLHMMCPLLTLTTNRDEREIGNIGLGASRFLVLQAGDANQKSEALAFTQLDPTAVDRLAATYATLNARAKGQSAQTDAAGVIGPTTQSGVSRAWTFKTGEERPIALTARALEETLDHALDLAAIMQGEDPDAVSIRFPDSFDVRGPAEVVTESAELADLFARYNLPAGVAEVLRRAYRASVGRTTSEAEKAFEKQLQALAEEDMSAMRLEGSTPLAGEDARTPRAGEDARAPGV